MDDPRVVASVAVLIGVALVIRRFSEATDAPSERTATEVAR